MTLPPWYSFDYAGKNTSDSVRNHQRYVMKWCDAINDEARVDLEQNEEIVDLDKHIKYLMGKQWSGRRPSYKASPVANRTWTNLIQLVSYLTDIRQSFEVQSKNKDYTATSVKLNNMARSWFIDNDVDMTTAMVIIYSALTTGYARQVWNQELNNGDGDIEMTACGPLDVIPIKPTHNLQGSYGLIYEKPMSLAWFRQSYPMYGDLVQAEEKYSRYRGKPTATAGQQYWHLGAAYRRLFGINDNPTVASAIPMGKYREFWLKDYCLVPETKVLTSDLRWIKAGDVKAGDELIGCDEEAHASEDESPYRQKGWRKSKGSNRQRWLRRTRVESVVHRTLPCLRVTTDKGEVTCSTDHRWLVKSGQSGNRNNREWWIHYEWKRTEDICPGDQIAYVVKPWDEDPTREAGWLAGLFDGEGWLTPYSLGFAQNSGGVLQAGLSALAVRGYTCGIHNSCGEVRQVQITGGREDRMRFIGSIRPRRLLDKSSVLWEGKLIQGRGVQPAVVLSIVDVGERDVVSIQTDRRTFIAEGLISHNSINTSNKEVYVGDMNKGTGYMVQPRGRLYPRGRLVIMGGSIVLYDGPNPHWHGRFPFSALRINQVPWQWPGVSEFRNQLPLQDIMNTILAGILDMVKKAVNPPVTAPLNAFNESVRKTMDPNMPGARLYYNPGAGQPPVWAQVAQLPSFVFEAMLYARDELVSQTGFIDAGAAMGKKIIPSSDTLESLGQGQQTLVRLKVRYIEAFFREIGEQWIANAFQYYRTPRRVLTMGLDGLNWTDWTWDPREITPDPLDPGAHWRTFKWTVLPGSLLKSARTESKVTALNLRRTGDMDRENMFKILDLESIHDSVVTNLRKEGADVLVSMIRQKMSGAGGGGGLSPDVLNQLNNATKEAPEPIN